MSKKLLIETHTFRANPITLTENVNKNNGNLVVEGILATAEVKNGNGRYYAKDKEIVTGKQLNSHCFY